ncbi:MAG: arylsulfotransferase (ASST), partial [Myxococcales bacterium]|nr:arylsulfotransferase (ASST) [Myxococcales bacterium]
GKIVWEWRAAEHLVQAFDATKPGYAPIANHPELADLNFAAGAQADWTHVNSVDYDAASDQVLLSVHNFDEIWAIDHSTTSAEAKGHTGGKRGKGGDILYRWGNPQSYGAGVAADQ